MNKTSFTLIRQLLRLVQERPGRRTLDILAMLFWRTIAILAPMQLPLLIGAMLDRMVPASTLHYGLIAGNVARWSGAGGPVLALFAVAWITGLSNYLFYRCRQRVSNAMMFEWRQRLIETGEVRPQDQELDPLSFFANTSMDVEAVERILDQTIVSCFSSLLLLACPLLMLVAIDPWLASIALAVTGMLWGIAQLEKTGGAGISFNRSTRRRNGDGEGYRAGNGSFVASHHVLFIGGMRWVAAVTGLALLWWSGEHAVLAGTLTPGLLVASAGLMIFLFVPFWNGVPFTASPEMERVLETLRSSPVKDPVLAPPLVVTRGRIRCQSVFVRRGGRRVLDRVSLEIAPGQMTVLLGPRHAGKSTLLRLMARIQDPDAGSILVDGQSLRAVRRRSVRANIAYIPEAPVFFPGTVWDNLSPGGVPVSRTTVEEACDTMFVLQMIRSLPKGFHTPIGPGGVQPGSDFLCRLALARALLRRPRILLLDEPFSGLELASQIALLNALKRLRDNHTLVIAAARMEHLRDADQVYLIREGRLIDQGTPGVLMRRRALLDDVAFTRHAYRASPF